MATAVENEKLTFKQRKAIYYLAVTDMDLDDVSDKINKPPHVIKRWLKNPVFRDALDSMLRRIEDEGVAFRGRNNQIILEKVYESIHKKIHEGVLDDLKVTTLLQVVNSLASQYRADVKVTGKTEGPEETNELKKLQDRFAQSQSAKVLPFHKKKKASGG